MKVGIYISNYDQVNKNLIDELKSRKVTIIDETRFGTKLELNVNSFDEVIRILEKYSKGIEITLSICNVNKVSLFITSRKTSSSLGDQFD